VSGGWRAESGGRRVRNQAGRRHLKAEAVSVPPARSLGTRCLAAPWGNRLRPRSAEQRQSGSRTRVAAVDDECGARHPTSWRAEDGFDN